jgi:hypothetical protein
MAQWHSAGQKPSQTPPSAADAVTLPQPNELPLVANHDYQLSGAARPFMLFWIHRNDVGGGRMTWRRDGGGTFSLELLMGSDPARAPFSTNRWGYIREVVHGDTAELVAVKTELEEETIEEAKASAGRPSDGTLVFIRERVTPRDARAWTAVVDVGRDVTYNDLEFVLDRMSKVNEWNERTFDRPKGTRPGFLVALTELMDDGVRAWSRAGSTKFEYAPQTVFYIHRAKPYELRQSRVKLLHDVTLGGHTYSRLLEGEFRMRNPATNFQSIFSVAYGLDGDLAAVPVRIAYQPRWWLRTSLTLTPTAKDGL